MGLKCHVAIIIFHIWSTPVYLRETKTLYNLEVRYIVQRCNMVRVGHAYNLRVTIFYANEWQILIARDLKFELYADLVHIQLCAQQSTVHVCTSKNIAAYSGYFVHCAASIAHGLTTFCRKVKTVACPMCKCNPYSFRFNRWDILLL